LVSQKGGSPRQRKRKIKTVVGVGKERNFRLKNSKENDPFVFSNSPGVAKKTVVEKVRKTLKGGQENHTRGGGPYQKKARVKNYLSRTAQRNVSTFWGGELGATTRRQRNLGQTR